MQEETIEYARKIVRATDRRTIFSYFCILAELMKREALWDERDVLMDAAVSLDPQKFKANACQKAVREWLQSQ